MVRIEDHDRVRLLVFNRPDVLNAFNSDLYAAAGTALDEAASDDRVSVVVLTGEGRAFSAGQDLAEMLALSNQRDGNTNTGDRAPTHRFATFMDAIMDFPKPLIAAVNGVGVGVGLTMLGYCDLVLMADSARLRAPFTSLGVVPEAGGSFTLPERMGWPAAAHAIFTSSWIDAGQAVACGLAWKSVPGDRLRDEALAVAAEIAAMPLVALVESKKLLSAVRLDAARAARTREEAVFAELTGAPDNRAALEGFVGKRDRS
jgi:enoyl-CoA hydratase/carnithine racemase